MTTLKKILALLMVIGVLAFVGCSKEKEKTPEDMAREAPVGSWHATGVLLGDTDLTSTVAKSVSCTISEDLHFHMTMGTETEIDYDITYNDDETKTSWRQVFGEENYPTLYGYVTTDSSRFVYIRNGAGEERFGFFIPAASDGSSETLYISFERD